MYIREGSFSKKGKIIFKGKNGDSKVYSEECVYMGIDTIKLMHKIQLEDGRTIYLSAMYYSLLTDGILYDDDVYRI